MVNDTTTVPQKQHNHQQKVDPRCVPYADQVLSGQIHNLIQQAARVSQGALTCGANQVTKQLNHGKATLVLLAADCNPLEIILHLVLLCEDKGVPYIFLPSQTVIGNMAELSKSVSACCFGKNDMIAREVADVIQKVEILM